MLQGISPSLPPPHRFEKINSDLCIVLEPFTMENDLLTPTFKTKRNVAAKVFKNELETLYKNKVRKAVAKL